MKQGEAHGKAILIGEHSVVHGTPAVALPVDLKVSVELSGNPLETLPKNFRNWFGELARDRTSEELFPSEINSELPLGSGLGSSAAVSVAAIRALLPGIEQMDLVKLADEAEQIFHGNPSGVDVRTVCSDTPIRFQRSGGDRSFQPVAVGAPLSFEIWITPKGDSTAEVVARVGRTLEEGDYDAGIALAEEIISAGIDALESGDVEGLGLQMTRFHREWLAPMGASTPFLDELVGLALDAGALGAKLTGGGGGGSMIVLVPPAWNPDAVKLPQGVERVSFNLPASG